MLVISGDVGAKNNPITIGYYCIPMVNSNEAKQHTVMIDSDWTINCAERSTDKSTNKIFTNPAEMIGDKKLLILKHEKMHFKPLINASTPEFDSHWPKYNSFNVFDNIDESQKTHRV